MSYKVAVSKLAQPPDHSGVYVHRTPAWLVATFRGALLVTSLITTVLSAQNWAAMPIPAILLALIIAPSLLAISVWPRPWKCLVKFRADAQGLYFPHNTRLVPSFTIQPSAEWLFVPWPNVDNLRISTETGGEGSSCIAFDLKLSLAEREQFFKHVGTPCDRPVANPETVFASYDDSPPQPAKTLKILNALRSQREA